MATWRQLTEPPPPGPPCLRLGPPTAAPGRSPCPCSSSSLAASAGPGPIVTQAPPPPCLTLPGGGVPACERETENKFLRKPCVALQSAAGWGTGLPTPSGTGCHPGGGAGWWEVPRLGKQVPGGAQRCSDKGQGRAVQGKLRASETHPGLPGRSHGGNSHGQVSLHAGCGAPGLYLFLQQ